MRKSDVLGIGCGGCGNKLLDVFLDLDPRYTGIFMNTNLSEMEELKHFDRNRRCFYVPNADGTGKNRDLAEDYIKEEAPKFAEMIKKFTQTNVIFFASSNGGTGSKAIIMLSRLVKKLCPEKTISVIGTFPNIRESDIDFDNATDFWNELNSYKYNESTKKGFIDNIQLIDNNKLSDENEINIRAMKQLDESFSIAEGKLDNTDVERYHTSKGYKVILKLEDGDLRLKDAIDKAISDSMYYIPSNLDCDVMVGDINISKFKAPEIQDEIEVFGFKKFNEKSEGDSILLLGGCVMPTDAIELVQEASKELRRKKRQRNVQEDYIVRKHTKSDDIVEDKQIKTKVNSKVTSEDLKAMFEDDDFWNE